MSLRAQEFTDFTGTSLASSVPHSSFILHRSLSLFIVVFLFIVFPIGLSLAKPNLRSLLIFDGDGGVVAGPLSSTRFGVYRTACRFLI